MAPEAHTAVVVDTTSYLPEELIDRYGIHRVSLYVTLDGEQKRESEIAPPSTTTSTSGCAKRGGRDHVAAVGRRLP